MDIATWMILLHRPEAIHEWWCLLWCCTILLCSRKIYNWLNQINWCHIAWTDSLRKYPSINSLPHVLQIKNWVSIIPLPCCKYVVIVRMMIMMSYVKRIWSVSDQLKSLIHHLCQFAAWRNKPHRGVEMFVASAVLEHVKDDVGEGENREEEEANQHPPPLKDCLKIHELKVG